MASVVRVVFFTGKPIHFFLAQCGSNMYDVFILCWEDGVLS